jgi:pimeloyl-ACP methyl ester carboxylesterase
MPPDERAALDRYVEQIAVIVLEEPTPYRRAFRLESLRAASRVALPPTADLPADERQTDFFASPLWRDRLAFDPAMALSSLHGPVLVLIGTEDPDTPVDAYRAAVTGALAGAETADAVVCVVEGRTRHAFTDENVSAIDQWLRARLGGAGGGARDAAAGSGTGVTRGGRPTVCLDGVAR